MTTTWLHERIVARAAKRYRDRFRHRSGVPPSSVDLAACAVFRNEAPYLVEWLCFHRLVGIEHFFLYDDRSSDEPMPALQPFIDEGLVTVHSLPALPRTELNRQPIVYNACLEEHGHRARWMAFIDLDEFLFSPGERTLLDVLEDHTDHPGVAANWVMFTTGGHVLQEEGLVIERFTTGSPQGFGIYKLIVQPARTARMTTAHHAAFTGGDVAVSTDGRAITEPLLEPPVIDRLRINHYWSKSAEECLLGKMARGALLKSTAMREVAHLFVMEREFARGEDLTIQRYLPALREGAARYSAMVSSSSTRSEDAAPRASS